MRVSDVAIAKAVAAAARETTGVVDLSRGLGTVAATYGPGERIVGVVVHRASSDEIIIAVHVILGGALYSQSLGDTLTAQTPVGDSSAAPLLRVADQIRGAVNEAFQVLNIPAPRAIDVHIDDMQLPS